ncbi:MAG TPA: glycosyltransferase family 9 protein [Bdellovibrionota bacterium]|nr:glycosyltransferase family 9 protein [Bdellovibrionota bacterium]
MTESSGSNRAGDRRQAPGNPADRWPLHDRPVRPKKVLAMKLRALGDTVLMTAPVLELQRAFPDAELHVAVQSSWAPVFDRFPNLAQVWGYERHKERAARAKALARLALKLRRERFDLVVNFHASPSSATISFATGARHRSIHFHGHKDKNRYSTVRIPGKGTLKPIVERDMDAVRALGIQVPEGGVPRIFLQEAEIARASERLGLQGFTGRVLGLGLGSSRPTKCWPVDRFAEVAVRWCKDAGGSAVAFAGPGERERGLEFLKGIDEALRAHVPDVRERAVIRARIGLETSLDLRFLTAMLGRCAVVLGNDSGPRHLAVAAGVPTVTLFGPEHPFEWHPYPLERHPRLFMEPLECRKDAEPGMPAWCGIEVCVEQAHRCMTMIGADPVLVECLRVATP